MSRAGFATTGERLQRNSPPMRLYEKAKKYGCWNPSEIDFAQDRKDWRRLAPDEQDLLLRLTALFQAGEEAVTLDLLPLIMVIAAEGRLEEELFLTTFLFEEGKHTDFFSRALSEVFEVEGGLDHYHTPNYRYVFYEALPEALAALVKDRSPAAQVRAAATYNMVVEGVLAETGYYAHARILEEHDLMPGIQRGVGHLRQDESRHIAYGLHLLSRHLSDDPSLWSVLETQMKCLLPPVIEVIAESFLPYDPVPFGLVEADLAMYAAGQFSKRMDQLERGLPAVNKPDRLSQVR